MASLINEISIKTIYIMLGGKCNFKCRHCLQECSENNSCLPKGKIKDNVVKYINHLINIRPDDIPKLKIMFWGGEPLCYLEEIKDVIDKFNNKVSYALVTNGSLLTDTVIKFLNEHKVHVALSNDGKDTAKVRGINLLDDDKFVELFSKLESKSIDSVIHAYNADYQALRDYLHSRIGKDIYAFPEQLVVTWDMPTDISDVDLDAYKDSLHLLAGEAYYDIIAGKVTFAVDVFYNTLSKIAFGRRSPSRKYPNCMQTYTAVNIDVDGNVYACHNSTDKIGRVEDDRLQLVNTYDEWVNDHLLPKCLECEYFEVCRGGCPLELHDDNGKKLSCERLKIYYQCCYELADRLNNYFEEVDLEV